MQIKIKNHTQVFIQTPYAMLTNWPPGNPDSSWHTASIKAEQPVCKECRIAKQEKCVAFCTTIKCVQEKENTLSSKVSKLPVVKGLNSRRQQRVKDGFPNIPTIYQ